MEAAPGRGRSIPVDSLRSIRTGRRHSAEVCVNPVEMGNLKMSIDEPRYRQFGALPSAIHSTLLDFRPRAIAAVYTIPLTRHASPEVTETMRAVVCHRLLFLICLIVFGPGGVHALAQEPEPVMPGILVSTPLQANQPGLLPDMSQRPTPAPGIAPAIPSSKEIDTASTPAPDIMKPPPAPEPLLPLPLLPPGYGMGFYPPHPGETPAAPSLKDLVDSKTTVSLRQAGLLKPYGFVRGDLDFATARFNDLQFPFYVLPHDDRFNPKSPHPNDTLNYSLYPRLSRLGLEYFGPKIDSFYDAVPTGRLEIDFLTNNPGGSESRQLLRLRLAYAAVAIDDFTLLVGQDWDIVSPLLPTINMNTNQWNNGNLGDRRPQVKLLYDHDFDGGRRLQVQGGIALANAINSIDSDENAIRDNEAWGIPGLEGRVGVIWPTSWENQPIMAGIWAFQARQRTLVPATGKRIFSSYGYGIDVRVPICEELTFQAEAWQGSNMDDFRGGIAQGINYTTGQTIASRGGFAELVYRPVRWYQQAIGYSLDDPTNSDVPASGRTLNRAFYASSRFPVGKGLLFSMEAQHWLTEWKSFNAGEAVLLKFFTQYNF
ncbi:hypothetical protein BH10PLA2_BH10PLA2_08040 [soil metagenome]